MCHTRYRRGVTLLELLVVIAILAVLVSLLLPAVQQVRSNAAKTRCANHLKQLGIALHQYHNTHAALPPGLSVNDRRFPEPFLTWNARLLPFLDEGPLWREVQAAFARDANFLHVPPHVHRATVVPHFACPADSRTAQVRTKGVGQKVAFTAYLGVAGRDLHTPDGLLFADSAVRLADVTDGSTNTVIAGERPPSADERYGWWYAGWGQDRRGSAEVFLGVRDFNVADPLCFVGPYRFGAGRIDNQCDAFHFWSLHPGGAHFLFADGRVQFLSYTVHPLLPALATRAGGEAVALD